MRIITFLLVLTSVVSQAQLRLSAEQLDFSDVVTTSIKELSMDITNSSNSPVSIADVVVYNDAFTVDYSNAEIASGSTTKLKVIFSPTHNIIHNTEAIILVSNGSQYSVDLIGAGRYEGTYYAGTFNKSYQALKDELKTILASGYTNLGYSTARDRMYGNIDNVNGKVTCVYTGRVATFNTRSGANSSSFNCEHTWPQSLFSSREPERADIHHLFPTDVNSNSRRGSFPFGLVSSATWSEGGSKVGGGKFEPRDAQKGATARAMIYFAIRYQDYSNFIDGQESILREWHKNYPPLEWDSTRNANIFTYQKNRNPFIDHPEFTERIGKIGANDVAPEIKSAEVSVSSIDFLTVKPADQRTVYLVNSGNTDLTGIGNITTKNGDLKVIDFSSSVKVGEALALIIGFSGLTPGSYEDELQIDLNTQIGESISVPVTFNLVASNIEREVISKFFSFYNSVEKSLILRNVPHSIEEVSIYGINGRLIELDDISSSFTDIPFRGYSSGLYFVVIKTENKILTSRFLVD